jgi:hypothetical protein
LHCELQLDELTLLSFIGEACHLAIDNIKINP